MRSLKTLLSDESLREEVEGELTWEPRVDAGGIRVAARDGSIALTGSVPSYAQKRAAVQAAERVYGVKAVADDLDVKLPAAVEKKDAEIAREIAREREWNTLFPESVEVEVSKGHVTLGGEVEWSYQRDEAAHAVQRLAGVRDVTNLITVAPRTEPEEVELELERRIEDALARMADQDARSIGVTASNGIVRLHGTVRSVASRRVAERAAESAPGVVRVESEIVVEP